MVKKIITAAVFCTAMLAGGIFMAHSGQEKKEPSAPAAPVAAAPALTVSQGVAHTVRWPQVVEATGPVAPWQEAIIGAEIAGQRLTEVLADVGDTVSKGQVLARYNPDTLLAAQAELKANAVQAAADKARALKLKGTHAVSEQEVESAVNQAAVAQARLEANMLQLKYTTVVAPDDGVISARSATLGAVGSIGQELFRLIRQNRLEWRGQLTAAQLDEVRPGQAVDIVLPDSSHATATVTRMSPLLDSQTRLATIYAEIKPGSHARAGMFGAGRIELAQQDVLAVPARSIVIRDGYSYVFKLVHRNGTVSAAQVKVTTGDSQGDETEVTGGLRDGDAIAVKGAGFLNDGDTVRLAAQAGE
jgi:RND family efflux transporter MFP subunit